jgi:DNA-binding ferritin-like protein
MRYLGVKPVSSLSRVLEVSGVGEAKTNISSMEMISDLLEDHKKIISMCNDAAVEEEKQKSRGTINLLDDLNEAHGKFVWMLRSFTE